MQGLAEGPAQGPPCHLLRALSASRYTPRPGSSRHLEERGGTSVTKGPWGVGRHAFAHVHRGWSGVDPVCWTWPRTSPGPGSMLLCTDLRPGVESPV